jgi:hypothetical protein
VTGSLGADDDVEIALMKHTGPLLTCDDAVVAFAVQPINVKSGREVDALRSQLSLACLRRLPFTAAIVVLRDPYAAIWAEFHRTWSASRAGADASPGQVQRLAFSFMSDEELGRFAVFAIRMAAFWEVAHTDMLRFRARSPDEVLLVRHEDLASGDETTGAAALQRIALFLGLDMGSSPNRAFVEGRAHCAFVLARRGLARDLTPQQQLTSMDQLYEGVTTCKMWALFGRVATELGYREPFNRMPCVEAAEAPLQEVATCGWFQWALGSQSQDLGDYLGSCL